MKPLQQIKNHIQYPLTLLLSALLTYCYIAFDFQDTHNIFVILLIFTLFELLLLSFWKKRECSARGGLYATLCGFLLSLTSLIGVLTETKQFFVLKSINGILSSTVFLFSHTVLLGMLCLRLFTYFHTSSQAAEKEFKNPFWNHWSFKKIFFALTIVWMIDCIMHFPLRMGGGSPYQLRQFFGEDTVTRHLTSVVYEGHFITNHHPVLLTYLYGFFFKLGTLLGDMNSAAFLLSCITLISSSLSMAYLLKTLQSYLSKKVFLVLLIICCFYPVFVIYSHPCCKDNLFTNAILIFYALIARLIFEQGAPIHSKRFCLAFAGISILIPFLKNQGLYIVLITLFFMLLWGKGMRKILLINIGTVILTYVILFSNILLPALKIAPGGTQEALSIPFQQTALYVREYGHELTQEEYNIINEILPVDEIGEAYNARLADKVKFNYRQDATRKELIDYFILWGKQFFRHPGVYLEAFTAINDGYYYIDYDEAIQDLYPSIYEFGAATPTWAYRYAVKQDNFWNFITKLPIFGCLFRTAIFSWLLIFTAFYSLYRRQYKWLLILLPVFLSLGICLLCPWNGVTRYALPIIYALPLYITLCFKKDLRSIE